MGAIPATSRQCVIWFGRPLNHERVALAAAGWRVRIANTTEGIGMRCGDTVVGLVDLRSDHADGLDALEQLTSDHAYLSLIAILPTTATDHPSPIRRLLDRCVEAFSTPVDLPRMIRSLGRLAGCPQDTTRCGLDALIGRSPLMRAAHATIRRYAPVELPVLITGKTGTGKEVAARALHDLSPRRAKRFTAINCGALPPNLVQSELFGYERGAFTGATARRAGLFESANGGTVFLDEIGDLPLDAQTNLLRVLQEDSLVRVGGHQPVAIDVRILAATNLDLEQAMLDGRFRNDLFYRLNVLRLHMPALADRSGDIPLLAQYFLEQFRLKHATRARAFSRDATRAMRAFDWPGHVRELLNRVQRAAVAAEAELITAAELELGPIAPAAGSGGGALDLAREAAERETILECLQQSRCNISETARQLKVSRVTVYRLCRKHGLDLDALR
ncbi:MAG: sigma 54-interacting transcriptional regulator [Lysobacter sp.]